MPESSNPSPQTDSDPEPALELPTAPEFLSRPPRLPFDEIAARCEELLPFELARPDFEERRLRTKVHEEFAL